MSILESIKNKLTFRKNNSQKMKMLDAGQTQSAVMTTTSNPLPRSSAALIAAYGATPSLRSVVGKIASSTAQNQWRLFAQRGKNSKKAVKNVSIQRAGFDARQKSLAFLSANDELEEISEHPFLSVLYAPNDMMTGLACREVMQVFLELAGEAFLIVFRNSQGAPNSAIAVSPVDVQDLPTSDDPTFKIKLGQGKIYKVPITECIWFRTVDPANLYGRGSGFASSLADELDIAEYSAKQISSFFWNQAMPNFIVSVEGAGKSALKRAQTEWEQGHKGFRRAYRTKWTGGKMSVQRLDTNFRDMNIVELRKHTRDVIAQTWGVPPEILGIVENSNRATITAAEYIYAQQVICPRLEAMRETLQRFIEREYDDRLILHYDSPVPNDEDFRLKAMQSQPAAYSQNEWRSISGADKKDGGDDVYFVPSGLTIEDKLKPKQEDNSKSSSSKLIKKEILEDKDIEKILSYLSGETMRKEMSPELDDVASGFGAAAMSELPTEIVFSLQNPLIEDEIENILFDRINGITETTKDILRKSIVEGIFAGESIDLISERISDIFENMSEGRAWTIAQNSVHQVANAATQSAMEQSLVVERKQWVTSFVRSRDTHKNLHGQIKPLDQKFVSDSGATALYPHSFGVSKEDINCRCTEVAVIDDPKSIEALNKIAEQKELDLLRYDSQMVRAVRRAFKAQNRELQDALKGIDDG